jgi:hypothetical protein
VARAESPLLPMKRNNCAGINRSDDSSGSFSLIG